MQIRTLKIGKTPKNISYQSTFINILKKLVSLSVGVLEGLDSPVT